MALSALAAAATGAAQPPLSIPENPADVDSSLSSSLSSLSSSPRQFPTDFSSPILEEGDETESEPPNEPVTPTSGRQSHDFHPSFQGHDINSDFIREPVTDFVTTRADFTAHSKRSLVLTTGATTPATARPVSHSSASQSPAPPAQPQNYQSPTPTPPQTQSLQSIPTTPSAKAASDESGSDPAPGQLSRRSTRGSASRLTRMASFLKGKIADAGSKDKVASRTGQYPELSIETQGTRKTQKRGPSLSSRSSTTTRSNTPPSPGSPLEMAVTSQQQAPALTIPSKGQYISHKPRASTGLHFGRVGILGSSLGSSSSANNSTLHTPLSRQRASSFEDSQRDQGHEQKKLTNQPWGLPPAEGTGVKARRMSLSLPDDFAVDVGNLLDEFEYQSKFLGRHGKHLGKGATSKVTLMVRRGNPGELYAVKEFRGRMPGDTVEEHEKKVKSEFTLAKSLHHPNVIETIRLCKDHSRWNHVMEYCQEGDLFSLVKKGYLKVSKIGDDDSPDPREKDRLCLFKQLLQAVNYLHSNGIAHRDIKLENLLMTSDSRLKLTDFGVSEVFCGVHPGLREAGGQCGQKMGDIRLSSPGICGSMPYISPEVISKQDRYDPRGLDVWSSGIVMVALIFGAPLWDEAKEGRGNTNYNDLLHGWEMSNERDMSRDISERGLPKFKFVPFDVAVKPPALKRVLLQMLNPDPAKRLTISEVLGNRWIKNIECCQLESYDDPTQVIDASKMSSMNRGNQRKVFCHNHLPPSHQFSSHSLGKMPGQVGY